VQDQEKRSLQAFQQAVSEELFLVRSPKGDDYDVDRRLEATLPKGSMTNLFAHTQVKSTTSKRRLSNGSISYPIPVKTLNYLLT
jgi:hypothetical protein